MVAVILSRDVLAKLTNRLRIVRQILGILLLIVLLNPQNTLIGQSCVQRNQSCTETSLEYEGYFLVILKTQ